MNNAQGDTVLREQSTPIATGTRLNVSDQKLLERFTAHRDEAAFAGLVERYSRPVWGVCRRVLQRPQDAEDAFQATFLVLARKATSIRKGEAVGSWLYGVAYRTAQKARQTAARRERHEKQAAAPAPDPSPWGEAAFRELQRLLDEEVQKLAEPFRTPFVLCCLEGMSRAEAAQELGWPEGTVSGRLAKARELLRRRLARRGVALSAVLTAAALAHSTAAAAAPTTLVAATVQGVLAPLVGKAAVATLSPSAVSLAQGMFHTMAVAKLKVALSVVVALTTVIAGGTYAAFQFVPAAPDEAKPALPPPPAVLAADETFVPPPIPLLRTAIDEQVLTLAYSPDGKKLVTAGARPGKPGQFGTWDVDTGKNVLTIKGIPSVRSVAWSPGGETFATGDFSGSIRLWDARTGAQRGIVKAHNIGVNGVAFSRDGTALVSAGLDRLVKLWEVKPVPEYQQSLKGDPDDKKTGFRLYGLEAEKCVRFEPAGMRITLPAGHPGERPPTGLSTNLRLKGDFEVTVSYEVLGEPEPQDAGEKYGTRFSLGIDLDRPQRNVASISRKVGIKGETTAWLTLWNKNTGKNQDQFATVATPARTGRLRLAREGTSVSYWASEGHTGEFRLVQRFPFGAEDIKDVRIVGMTDGPKASLSVRFTDLRIAYGWMLRERKVFRGHTDMVFSAAFFGHDEAFVTGGQDKTARIWNIKTGDTKFTLEGHTKAVEAVAISPDDKTVATASWDGTVKLWDAATGKETATLAGEEGGGFFAVGFSAKGELVAAAAGDGTVFLWNVETKKLVGRLEKHATIIWALAFSPDGTHLATGSSDKTAKLWDLETRKATATLETSEFKPITALAYAPDGKGVAVATDDKMVRLRDARTGAVLNLFAGHADVVNCLAFSPTGQNLASGSSDKTIKLWDRATGKEKLTLTGHSGGVRALAFSPDGQRLASAGEDLTIRLWDQASGKELATIKAHESVIRALAFAPDGRLASGGADKTIKIWDLSREPVSIPLKGHEGVVRVLAFSSDGTLASGSEDGTVKLWAPAQDKERLTLQPPLLSEIWTLAFSPSGRTLASAGADPSVIVWDAVGGLPRTILRGHRAAVTALAMHPTGEELLSGSQDTSVLRWRNANNKLPRMPDVKNPPGDQIVPEVRKVERLDPPKLKTEYAREYYHSFKGNPEKNQDFELAGPEADQCVKYEAAGLRLTFPRNFPHVRGFTGVAGKMAIKGDFEITVGFELLNEPDPGNEGEGTGFGVTVDLDTDRNDHARLNRAVRFNDRLLTTYLRVTNPADGKKREPYHSEPTTMRTGRLRMVRTGNMLSFFVAEGSSDDFKLIHQDPFSPADVKQVLIAGTIGGPQAAEDVRILDLRIRADSLPGTGSEPALGTKDHEKGWLTAGVLVGLVLVLFLGGLFYVRKRRGAEKPPARVVAGGKQDSLPAVAAAIIVHCAGCGKDLKVKAEFAGRKAKCPKCGQGIIVPRS